MARAQRALTDIIVAPISRELELHWIFLSCRLAQSAWDDAAWDALSSRMLELVRGSGVLALLPMVAAVRVGWELFAGDLACCLGAGRGTGHGSGGDRRRPLPRSRLALAAYRGHEAEVAQLDEATTRQAVADCLLMT